MSEFWADDYPTRTLFRGCGMEPWLDVAKAVSLVGLAAILVAVWFRYFGGDDHH